MPPEPIASCSHRANTVLICPTSQHPRRPFSGSFKSAHFGTFILLDLGKELKRSAQEFLALSACCSYNLIDCSSNIMRRVNYKMITRYLLPSGAHPIIGFPPCLRETLRHGCRLSSQKTLSHRFRRGLNPDQSEFGSSSLSSAIELLPMMLQKIRGIEKMTGVPFPRSSSMRTWQAEKRRLFSCP